MGRAESQHRRLQQLEKEMYALLRRHLEREATGVRSMYLLRQLGAGWTSKVKSDPETDMAERLEKEVVQLRQKLGEPPHGGPLAIIAEYRRLRQDKSLLSMDARGFMRGAVHRAVANTLLASDLWARADASLPGPA